MGFVDKLKNIFFEEEEEEEIEEPKYNEPKKEPKVERETIARRVEIPKRTEIKNVEIEPSKEIKEEPKEEIKYIEPKKEVVKHQESKITDLIFDDEDFILDTKPKEKDTGNNYKFRDNRDFYKKEEPKKETPKYEYSKRVEQKTTRTFTPSPIISPIYGILDKNYTKDEVKERKEVRITSRTGKVDFDSVRNKAFGDLETELFEGEEEPKEEPKKETVNRDFKKARINKTEDKPTIEKVTLGEADEYFNDLGLAYNTDYKDISKEINDGKYEEKKKKEDKLEDNLFDLIESMYDKED